MKPIWRHPEEVARKLKEVGLATDALLGCAKSQWAKAQEEADARVASELGAKAFTFFVGGEPYDATLLPRYPDIRKALEERKP